MRGTANTASTPINTSTITSSTSVKPALALRARAPMVDQLMPVAVNTALAALAGAFTTQSVFVASATMAADVML